MHSCVIYTSNNYILALYCAEHAPSEDLRLLTRADLSVQEAAMCTEPDPGLCAAARYYAEHRAEVGSCVMTEP